MTSRTELGGHGHREHDHGHEGATVGGYESHPDHDDVLGPLEDNPIWQQENVTLRSVGIDIGSSGTQVVFSRLKLQRSGAALATRYVVVERTNVFQSMIAFTPFTDAGLIDAPALGTIIDSAYAAANIEPEDIDTGVVILTGEALLRENAKNIALIISMKAGDFVCATAGHHMEAALAAFGSGAVQVSSENKQQILNIDIGGGTTKLSLIVDGRITSTAALHIGGRLLVVDPSGRLVRFEKAASEHAKSAGIELRLGDNVSPQELNAITDVMVEKLVAAISPSSEMSPTSLPYLTEPISDLSGVSGVIFSGGVGEYVYGTEDRDFCDLGRRLGLAIKSRLLDGSIPFPLQPAAARIRATALGASEFSVQLSGNTCYISDRDKLLPRRNLQVLRPDYVLAHKIDVESLTAAIRRHLTSFDVPDAGTDLVLALTWTGELSHARLHAMAQAVVEGLADRIATGHPVLLALDADVGRSLGSLLREELGVTVEILVVDGLNLLDFDYIDLGSVLEPSQVIPVTIKSLVF